MPCSRNFLNSGRCRLLWRQLQHFRRHLLARLEFHHRPRRNRHIRLRTIWIPPDPGFTRFDFKNSEIAEFDFVAFGKGLSDVIERLLDDIEHLLLGELTLLANASYQVAFCKCHKVLWLMVLAVIRV